MGPRRNAIWIPSIAVLVLAAGCATSKVSTDPVSVDVARLKNASIIRAVRYRPEPLIVRLGHAASLRIQEIAQELRLEDPTRIVTRRLVADLIERRWVRRVAMLEAPLAADNLATLKSRFTRGIVLDVKTSEWRLASRGLWRTRARFEYEGRARLVDLDGLAVVWAARCGEAGREAPRRDFVTNAAFFEAEIARVLERCAATLASKLLGADAHASRR